MRRSRRSLSNLILDLGLVVGFLLAACAPTPPAAAPTTAPAAPPKAEPTAPVKPAAPAEVTGKVAQPQHLRFAAFGLGSSWYVYAATFANLWRQNLPEGSTIDINPLPGATGNNTVVNDGKADLALTFSNTVKWAWEGKVAHDKPHPNIRVIAGKLDDYYLGIVAAKDLGITKFEDLKNVKRPIRIITSQKGTISYAGAQQALEAIGMSFESVEAAGGSVKFVSAPGEITRLIAEGQADLWFNPITIGHPALTEMAQTTDVVVLSLSPQSLSFLEKYGYITAELPAKSFKGQDQAVPAAGFHTVLIANKDLDPNVAYLLTKLLVENKEELGKGHAALKSFDPKITGKEAVPAHPGSEKYLKEKGLL